MVVAALAGVLRRVAGFFAATGFAFGALDVFVAGFAVLDVAWLASLLACFGGSSLTAKSFKKMCQSHYTKTKGE